MTHPPFQIADNNFWYYIERVFKEKGGVYILFSKQNDKIVPINRLLGSDANGVLYIGKADSFLDRVIELKKSLSPDHKSTNHECGYRWKKHDNINTNYPYQTLHVELIGSDHPRQLESDKMKEYEKHFGELPPLNRVQ
jgi:hypothetical protein